MKKLAALLILAAFVAWRHAYERRGAMNHVMDGA